MLTLPPKIFQVMSFTVVWEAIERLEQVIALTGDGASSNRKLSDYTAAMVKQMRSATRRQIHILMRRERFISYQMCLT